MNQVQVGQKSYQMPPQDGFTVAYFLTVADIERRMPTIEFIRGSLVPTALIVAGRDAIVPARRSTPLRLAIGKPGV